MKKFMVLVLVAVVALAAGSALAAGQKYPLGMGNFAIKVDYLRFTDSEADDLDIANAPYIGAELYFPVGVPNFYLGIESGYAWSSGDRTFRFFDFQGFPVDVKVDIDVDYVPIEFNAKYVFELSPCWTFDLGAGLSYNYFNMDVRAEVDGFDGNGGDSDWLFGGQFFADVNYKMGPWFMGLNIKYQLTEDMSLGGVDTDVSASNFRVGGQFGFMF